jgi:hypothetical protein
MKREEVKMRDVKLKIGLFQAKRSADVDIALRDR